MGLSKKQLAGELDQLWVELCGLRERTSSLIAEHDRQLRALKTNGVATAINKLNAEVFKKSKEKKIEDGWSMSRLLMQYSGGDYKTESEATLAGKVDAIIAHLGLDVEVQPEQVKKSQVVARKLTSDKTSAKKVTKKKGKK